MEGPGLSAAGAEQLVGRCCGPVICQVKTNYNPELARFRGLCWCRWGWWGRAQLRLSVGSVLLLACASSSAQPPLQHLHLCPSLRFRGKPRGGLVVVGLCAPGAG